LAGLSFGTPQPVSFTPIRCFRTSLTFTERAFRIGLVFVMYSFSGWNAATYIIGEMRHAAAKLPRALLAGTLIVLVLYVALNAVFLHTTPIDKLSGQLDVARIAGSHIFGEIGGRVVGAMICIGLVSFHQRDDVDRPARHDDHGEDMPALRVFARKSSSGAPVYAILFQLAVANLLLFTRSFRGRTRFHPVRAVVLLVLYRARRHQAAHHAARAAAALSRLGIPGNACGFPARDCLHDVLSVDGTAAAVIAGHFDDDLRPLIYAIFRKRADPGSAIAPASPE